MKPRNSENSKLGSNLSIGQTLSKTLTFSDLIAIGFGSCIAIGVFVLIGGVIKTVAGPAIIVSITVAGAAALLGGLCYCEYAVKFLKVNSVYAYSYDWRRENFAFIFGWALIWNYFAGSASVSKGIIMFTDVLTDYKLTEFLKNTTSTNFEEVFPYFDCFSFAVIGAATILLAINFTDAVLLKKICANVTIIIFASIVTSGAFKVNLKNWQLRDTVSNQGGFAPFGAFGIINGAAIIFYGFLGFDAFSAMGNDIKKRKRNLVSALFLTIFIIFAIHVVLASIISLMIPYENLNEYAAMPLAFEEVGWVTFKWVIAAAAYLSFLASLFGVLSLLPKLICSMANDGLLFNFLSNANSKSENTIIATVIGGLLSAVAAGIFTFDILVKVTVLGSLFVYTVLAIGVILQRYSLSTQDCNDNTKSWSDLFSKCTHSFKEILKNYFNCSQKTTNLTIKIIEGNLLLFCIFSLIFSIIFKFCYNELVECSASTLVPGTIFLVLIICCTISMMCQPKSQKNLPFKVPLVPLVPCLSIFLNTFLITTFDWSVWIIFLSWMILGIVPYFCWYLLKKEKNKLNENSLFEINRTNVLKLNESVWKIKTQKKSLYAGTINYAFSDELEFNKVEEGHDKILKECFDKISLQVKQAQIIQTTESVLNEKTEPLENNLQIDIIEIGSEDINHTEENDEKVQWECVAEIHTEDEFSQENLALKIVDNTYNFLMKVPEESSTNKPSKSVDEESSLHNVGKVVSCDSDRNEIPTIKLENSQLLNDYKIKKRIPDERKEELLKKDLLTNILLINNNNSNNSNLVNENKTLSNDKCNNFKEGQSNFPENDDKKSSVSLKSENSLEENSDNISQIFLDLFYEDYKHEFRSHTSSIEKQETFKSTSSDEQNKIKDFKEKLNQLLKNQIISGESSYYNFSQKFNNGEESKNNPEKNNEKNDYNIKTLNKSQIKGKLELLLAKGPPKRPSLGSSFNIKLKETSDESSLVKNEAEPYSAEKENRDNEENENFKNLGSTLEGRIKEKILTLKSISNEALDAFC